MKTTLDIDAKLLDAVLEATDETNRHKAIRRALEEYLRMKNVGEIRSAAGRFKVEDTTLRQRELDRKRQDILNKIRNG